MRARLIVPREHRKTHVTESRELRYPWHPWCGQVVYIHEVAEERGGRVFHCDLENPPSARCLTVPAWMFDRAVCLGVRRAEGRQVELAALVRLRTLLAEVANRASVLGTMIGARHSFDHRGDADAVPESSASNCPTRSVPLAESAGAQLARPIGRGARESDASHRADAEPAGAWQSSCTQGRRRQR
jgi:hypothetical protein